MSRAETLDIPFGELLDLIKVHQIKTEGFRQIREESFFELLRYE